MNSLNAYFITIGSIEEIEIIQNWSLDRRHGIKKTQIYKMRRQRRQTVINSIIPVENAN
jgi:hypothetical protein